MKRVSGPVDRACENLNVLHVSKENGGCEDGSASCESTDVETEEQVEQPPCGSASS